MPDIPSQFGNQQLVELFHRAVNLIHPELRELAILLERHLHDGEPISISKLAAERSISSASFYEQLGRALDALHCAIRSLEVDDEARQELSNWLSRPKDEVQWLSTSEVLTLLAEMDAA